MAYNRENFIRIRREYDGKNIAAKEKAASKLDELHRSLPDLREIDAALAGTGMKLMREMMSGGNDLDQRLDKIKRENEQLQNDRAVCLKYHGYPADYTDVRYECDKCSDTGFVGTKICECMRKKLIEAGYESSGIGNLMKTQSFETFRLEYYGDDKRALENIRGVLSLCRRYADNFDDKKLSNLLLCGATGLGKTHLSTSIAKVIVDRGFDVVYDTAQNIFGDFEYERFSRSYNDGDGGRTERYFDSDLLIIDDLGTEVTNAFTVSCLYNLINTRLNHDRSMIINTNLSRDELRKRYADRVTSRLFGEFSPLMFFGKDIREKKLM